MGINLLLWLCYFSHILSFALALLAIAVLWLATLLHDGLVSWRRHLAHVAVLAPQIVLPAWYFSRRGGRRSRRGGAGKLRPLFPRAGGAGDLRGGAAVAGRDAGGGVPRPPRPDPAAAGVRPWRDDRAFLILAAVLTLLYFVSPEGTSGGTMLKYRLCLYPYLVLIPWLAPGLGPRSAGSGPRLLALAALFNLGSVIQWYERLSGEMERYLAGLDPVRAGHPGAAALLRPPDLGLEVDVRDHAIGYKALEKGLIDWDNYEATTIYFPVRFRDPAPEHRASSRPIPGGGA